MVQNYRTSFRQTYELRNGTLHFTCIWCWKEFDSENFYKKYAEMKMLTHYESCAYFPQPGYKIGASES